MIQAYDPRTGEPVGEPVAETSDAEVDAIVAAAAAAFGAWSAFTDSERPLDTRQATFGRGDRAPRI